MTPRSCLRRKTAKRCPMAQRFTMARARTAETRSRPLRKPWSRHRLRCQRPRQMTGWTIQWHTFCFTIYVLVLTSLSFFPLCVTSMHAHAHAHAHAHVSKFLHTRTFSSRFSPALAESATHTPPAQAAADTESAHIHSAPAPASVAKSRRCLAASWREKVVWGGK